MAPDILLEDYGVRIDLTETQGNVAQFAVAMPRNQHGHLPELVISNFGGHAFFQASGFDAITVGDLSIRDNVVTARVWDFCVDHPGRRAPGADPQTPRRALVHDEGDRLTINWGRDYPGGVSIQGPVDVPDRLTVSGLDLAAEVKRLSDMVELLQISVLQPLVEKMNELSAKVLRIETYGGPTHPGSPHG